MRASLIFGSLVLVLTGCRDGSDLILVPTGEVLIYSDRQEAKILGKSSKPLDVVRTAYPDKTDYIVEVEFDGQRGFVKDGLFRLIEGRVAK